MSSWTANDRRTRDHSRRRAPSRNRPDRWEETVRADRVRATTQKYVVVVVLVPLSHVIVTVQSRNCGTAGTIFR
jgi:hypothetical protein